MPGSIPSHARVVVIGGGIVGCSVAYHLTKLGWRDVVLLERRELSCGTTWHAAGLVGQLRSSHNLTRLARYGAVLYERLEAETGQATGFRRSGSISVARTAERLIELKRGASMARCFGVDIEVISPEGHSAGNLAGAYRFRRPDVEQSLGTKGIPEASAHGPDADRVRDDQLVLPLDHRPADSPRAPLAILARAPG